ncbi:MAG: thioredoxin-dependent thiol peroxidase [Candidatus Omnitrophica bacterium]|nr:thioredoxin-dependent thiol peroxidase [Candidatus Omnitrophota bacterium]
MKIGSKAPEFKVLTDEGKEASLADFRGKTVILYFYPRDNTPGCTREACAFRDGLAQLKRKGAAVLGVSTDSVSSHQKFKNDQKLNFPLLSDADKKLAQAYGVWKEKSLYGRKYMGLERTTFVINPQGKITHIFPKVKVDGHFEEVFASL